MVRYFRNLSNIDDRVRNISWQTLNLTETLILTLTPTLTIYIHIHIHGHLGLTSCRNSVWIVIAVQRGYRYRSRRANRYIDISYLPILQQNDWLLTDMQYLSNTVTHSTSCSSIDWLHWKNTLLPLLVSAHTYGQLMLDTHTSVAM